MWYEIKIKTSNEKVEAINNILYSKGACGIVIEDPNDFIYSSNNNNKNWDYFEIDMSQFEYENTLIKAYIEFGIDANHKKVDYSTMALEIVALNGEMMAQNLLDKYEKFENLFNDLKDEIFSLVKFGFDMSDTSIEYTKMEYQDYNKKWQENYKAFKITDNIVVCPSWEDYNVYDINERIILDPGMAFGTGTHETTSMCAKMIEKYYKKTEFKVLYDIGTGSGILAFLGSKIGFETIIGVDIDEDAIKTANENLKINEITNVEFVCTNLLDSLNTKADMVVANIIADVIISMKNDLKVLLHENSIFIASGIIKEKLDDVVSEYKESGYDIIETKIDNEWAVMVCKLKGNV